MTASRLAQLATSIRLSIRTRGTPASAEHEADRPCPVCDHPFGESAHACIGWMERSA
jgi:hypothetical protein